MSKYIEKYRTLSEILEKYEIAIEEAVAKEMFENHMESFWDRIDAGELIDDDSYEVILSELKDENLNIADEISNLFYDFVPMMEKVLIATHIQTYFENKEENMDKKITVVIGHRLGKGNEVAKGVEKAGGKAIVIPGIAADMKLGDVMHEHDADVGISFCGSGGAGAITAQNKYGYKAVHHIRSIDAAVTAIEEGNDVIGLGFMDVEELGEKVVEAYRRRKND